MPTRSHAFFRSLAEGAVLAALVTVPLYFAVFTDRVFEPEKAALLRALALVAAAGGLVAWRGAGQGRDGIRAFARQPVLLAATAVWLAEAAATLASVAPWISLMGSHARGQGLLTSTALFVCLITAVASSARPGGATRLAACIGVTVFPAGLYGVVQSYGLDPLPWAGDVITRVVGAAGASVLLSAHLVMALPFAAWLAARAWSHARREASIHAALGLAAWLATLAVGIWALLLSGSRGPLLGLGAGIAIVGLAWLARAGRWAAALGVAGSSAALVGALIGLNLVAQRGAPPAILPLTGLPVVDRLSHALDPENSTTRVRLRLWDGAVLAIAAQGPRRLAGFGPEAMDLTYAPFYPPILAYDEPRGWVPDRAHNLALDTLLTTGALGLLAALAFFTALVDACLAGFGLLDRPRERRGWLACWVAGGATGILLGRALAPAVRPYLTEPALPAWTPAQNWLLAGLGLGLGLVAGLALWLVVAARRRAGAAGRREAADGPSELRPFAAAALAAVVAHLVEVQVGFGVIATRLVLAVVAGGLVGLMMSRQSNRSSQAPAEPESDTSRSPGGDAAGAMVALAVGITLAFDFARPGAVSGGHAVAAALILLSVVITGLAVSASVGSPALWLGVCLALGCYTLIHVTLLRAGTLGPADAMRGVAWTLAWYGLALLGLLVAWARWGAGGWPSRRDALTGGLAILLTCALAALAGGGPTLADALSKEGRLGWQAAVNDLRGEGESGKAESFLDRAEARFDRAARLAPWEPAYRLALARAAVERGDLLDARLSRYLAEEGQAELDDEYRADLPERLDRLVRERDLAFERALVQIAIAERLGGPAPGPALTRARALRVWGDRTRAPERRSETLATAREAYARAIARAPRWPELLDEAAVTALLAEDPRAAVDLTDRAIALDPYFLRAWRTAASAQAALGDPAAAAQAYARYFEDYRNAGDLPALRAYLEVLVAATRPAEALSIARDIARLAPGDPHAHADLAVLLQQAGELPAALAEARRAAELDPGDPAIAELLRALAGE